MTRHEQVALAIPALTQSKERQSLPQSVYAGIAGDLDVTGESFAAKVGSTQFGRREKQSGEAVDRDSEVLFRPRVQAIVAAKACFDVSDRYSRLSCTERSAERAGRVALNDDQSSFSIAAPMVRATSRT